MTPAAIFVILFATIFHSEAAPAEKASPGDDSTKCPLMVKVLDAVQGTPASKVKVTVSRQDANSSWTKVTHGLALCVLASAIGVNARVTGLAGEIVNLVRDEDFPAGTYKVAFDTKSYWKAKGITSFHEMADVVFTAHVEGHRHYTVALLLSPFSYTATAVVSKTHD